MAVHMGEENELTEGVIIATPCLKIFGIGTIVVLTSPLLYAIMQEELENKITRMFFPWFKNIYFLHRSNFRTS